MAIEFYVIICNCCIVLLLCMCEIYFTEIISFSGFCLLPTLALKGDVATEKLVCIALHPVQLLLKQIL